MVVQTLILPDLPSPGVDSAGGWALSPGVHAPDSAHGEAWYSPNGDRSLPPSLHLPHLKRSSRSSLLPGLAAPKGGYLDGVVQVWVAGVRGGGTGEGGRGPWAAGRLVQLGG